MPCINNLRQLNSAKEQWALAENKPRGHEISSDEESGLWIYIKHGEPSCPQGGTYTIGPIGQPPTCSIPGHELYVPYPD